MAREKIKPTDGLGPLEIKKIRGAVRLVWYRCKAHQLVVKRCTKADGYTYCERCLGRTPKLKVDHIVPVGDLDDGFIPRLMVGSVGLQGWCKDCHDEKTKQERAAARVKKNLEEEDFY